MKHGKSIQGYHNVNLSLNGKSKTCRVHRLVAKTFIPNPNNYPVINHIDGNKDNNSSNNLEWCTQKHNIIQSFKNGQQKPTWKGKKGKLNHLSKKINQYDLNGNFIKQWDSMRDVERELNIVPINISRCCRNIRNKAGGYKWEYAN